MNENLTSLPFNMYQSIKRLPHNNEFGSTWVDSAQVSMPLYKPQYHTPHNNVNRTASINMAGVQPEC